MSVQVERLGDHLAVLRLDRPERRNAMDSGLLDRMLGELGELAADRALRALVVSTTSTRALSVGADTRETLTPGEGQTRMRAFGRLYAAVEAFPVPTVAVMVGNVVGAGAELAAGCDLRVAGDNLDLAWVGAGLGIPVGVARLVPLVGSARAKELIYTGRRLGADEAVALGLAARAVPADEAEAAAVALATEIAGKPGAGLRRLKDLFRALDGSERRIAHENAVLEEFQRHGPGLPQGPRS